MSGHRTSCDIRWDDGSHTSALPLSRVRRLSPDAPPHTVDSPRPAHHSPPTTLLSGATTPLGDQPQLSPPSEPTVDPAPGTLVEARQSRHSQWYPATILSRRGPQNRRTFTVQWLDTSDGETSSSIPRSRIRALPLLPLPPTPVPLPAPAHLPPRTTPTPPCSPSTLHLQASPTHDREQAPHPGPLPRPGHTSRRASSAREMPPRRHHRRPLHPARTRTGPVPPHTPPLLCVPTTAPQPTLMHPKQHRQQLHPARANPPHSRRPLPFRSTHARAPRWPSCYNTKTRSGRQ